LAVAEAVHAHGLPHTDINVLLPDAHCTVAVTVTGVVHCAQPSMIVVT